MLSLSSLPFPSALVSLSSSAPLYDYRYIVPGLLVLATPLVWRRLSSSPASASSTTPSSTMAPDHTVVVLGAGFAGVAIAHHLLRHTPAGVARVRVVLVAPNDSLYFNSASVRGLLPTHDGPDGASDHNAKGTPGFGDEQMFAPLAPALEAYNAGLPAGAPKRAEQVLGWAARVDPEARRVEVSLLQGGSTALSYDTLVIATGSDATNGMPFKIVSGGGTEATKAALAAYRAGIRGARSVVVAGAGASGVEVAAELGYAYGGGSKSSGKYKAKKITYVIADDLPLAYDGVLPSVRRDIAAFLAKLGVTVVANTRVEAGAPADGSVGPATLALRSTSGATSTLAADVYIPALGMRYNTQFVPPAMLDAAVARIRTRTTLQAADYDNVFVIGDASNLEAPSIKNVDGQLLFLGPQLQTYISNWAAAQASAKPAPAPAPLKVYTPNPALVIAVALGPNAGTGQMGTWKVWGLLIWYLKSRFLGTALLKDYAAGKRTLSSTKW